MPTGAWGRTALLAGCLGLVSLLLVPAGGSPVTSSRLSAADAASARTMVGAAVGGATTTLSLFASTQPSEICASTVPLCTANVAQARVLLTATAPAPLPTWPAVQIAFVVERTAYDGVYDPNDPTNIEKNPGQGYDQCASAAKGLCEESNGVPFFVANAQGVANVIQAANPHTAVSFAMVDYAPTGGLYDDYESDQPAYHVDSSQFVSVSDFSSVVLDSFQGPLMNGGWTVSDEDLADNFLHSASISALYGAIQGSGLHWLNNTHHVIVWMGSTAPRDPGYMENYCASPSGMLDDDYPLCVPETCEPSFAFPTGVSPTCEGWVHSQDGNPSDSIAALAHSSPSCVNSVGGVCTIDTIDLWNTPTDPYSSGWPGPGGVYAFPGPGSAQVLRDSENILLAGCDLAAATGGTWDGPQFFTCPDGKSGTLRYVPHGPTYAPNTANPTLLQAFGAVGFGPVLNNKVAQGAGEPLFTFVPIGSIAVSSDPQFATSCRTPTGFSAQCQVAPTISHVGETATYGWNWSMDPAQNALFAGDSWSAAFNVIATGPPYRLVPVDACTTQLCLQAGSGALYGAFTWATYLLPNTTTRVVQSFPLTQVTVSVDGVPISPAPPSLPPPAPPALPVLAPISVNLPQPLAVPVQSPLGTVSIQATAAGLLMAGITRVMMKNKPVAMQMAMKNGPAQSQFDKGAQMGPEMGRFE